MPFTLTRHPFPPRLRRVRLAARTQLVPGFVRVRLQSDEPLEGFTSPGAGDHLRVFVPEEPSWSAVAIDENGHPTAPSRTETIVAFDGEAGWVDLDILVHAADSRGDAGLIGPWAAHAPLGSPAVIADPKGSVVLSGSPAAFVLAGDDSAIPALRRYLGMLGPGIAGVVLLETAFDPAALGVVVPSEVELRQFAPDPTRPSAALAAALSELAAGAPPAGPDSTSPERGPDVFVFACGEQSLLAPARALLAAWGIDVERAVAKGYWKRRVD
jgi:NADPH-dependent ferric siderophore reductase